MALGPEYNKRKSFLGGPLNGPGQLEQHNLNFMRIESGQGIDDLKAIALARTNRMSVLVTPGISGGAGGDHLQDAVLNFSGASRAMTDHLGGGGGGVWVEEGETWGSWLFTQKLLIWLFLEEPFLSRSTTIYSLGMLLCIVVALVGGTTIYSLGMLLCIVVALVGGTTIYSLGMLLCIVVALVGGGRRIRFFHSCEK